jgi:phage major head subunit gpT-like protein
LGAVHGYAVINTKYEVPLCIAWNLSELDNIKVSSCTSKRLSPASTTHPGSVESHVVATIVLGHFSTADETFALIKIEFLGMLQA